MENITQMLSGFVDTLGTFYLLPARYVFVVLVWLIVRWARKRMLYNDDPGYVHAVLEIDGGTMRLPITHYETTIGRSRSCDVVIPLAIISRQHAVMTMVSPGKWRLIDTKSQGGILVNGREIEEDTVIRMNDLIDLGGIQMVFKPPTQEDAQRIEEDLAKSPRGRLKRLGERFKPKKEPKVGRVFRLLNLFQILALIQLLFSMDSKHYPALIVSFAFLAVVPWVYKYIGGKLLGIKNMGAEAAAFFLTTIGICTTASTAPEGLYKQLAAVVLGLVIFCAVSYVLKNIKLVMKLRRYAALLSLAALLINLIFGANLNGQTNWIKIGSMTIQPSEFVKILFVFSSAATLEWLYSTKKLVMLTAYSAACIGFLFLMGDFGTALIFFAAFIVLMFMTSGDIRAVALTVVTAGLGGLMVLKFKPYITKRFEVWRNVWEHVYDTGFQQSRALMAIASGGLLGLGGGNGFLHRVYAADTDIVFGVICEEWGLLIGLLTISVYVWFLVSAIRSYDTSSSSYYVIAACGAGAIFLFQASLNIFGSTDILPLTGVTLPFISNGGSSMSASWGLLSFITAALNYAQPKLTRREKRVAREEEN